MTEKDKEQTIWLDALIQQATENLSPSDEAVWLRERFHMLGAKYGISRQQDIDCLVFQKISGHPPIKDSQLLKIRYWRTGRHKPQNREQCLELGHALELDEKDTLYLLQFYFDGADVIFSQADIGNSLYQTRLLSFGELEQQYLLNAHPDTLEQFNIAWDKPEASLRHYYFQDTAKYVSGVQSESPTSHFSSANYVNEFQRNRHLLGDIPRRTMLRHLFIMSAPFLSREILDARLTALGYARLSANHESRFGERLDCLILGLLTQYENQCRDKSPLQCLSWLQSTCRTLDEKLVNSSHPELRFLFFKALKSPL